METENEKVINFFDLFRVLSKRWIIVLVSGLLVAAISFCYFSFFVTEKYSASAQLFIDIRKVSSEGKDTYITTYHITTAKELATTYAYVIKTNIVLDTVIDELNLDISEKALADSIAISVVDDTPVLRINVTNPDKNIALKILTKLIEVAPEIINAKIDSGKLIAIDKPTVSSNPVSPNVPRNTSLGFFAGMFAVYVYFVLRMLTDNKIKSVDDINKTFDIAVLGVIPSLEHISKGKGDI